MEEISWARSRAFPQRCAQDVVVFFYCTLVAHKRVYIVSNIFKALCDPTINIKWIGKPGQGQDSYAVVAGWLAASVYSDQVLDEWIHEWVSDFNFFHHQLLYLFIERHLNSGHDLQDY